MKRRPLFFWLSWFYAVFFAALAVQWVLLPQLPIGLMGLHDDEGTRAVGVRLAGLMVAWAVTLFLARDLPPSPGRRAISYGMVALGASTALGGLMGLMTGTHGPGVLVALAVETLMAVGFLVADREQATLGETVASAAR